MVDKNVSSEIFDLLENTDFPIEYIKYGTGHIPVWIPSYHEVIMWLNKRNTFILVDPIAFENNAPTKWNVKLKTYINEIDNINTEIFIGDDLEKELITALKTVLIAPNVERNE